MVCTTGQEIYEVIMISYLPQKRKKNCRFLYEEVFDEDSKSFVEYYFNEHIRMNKVLVKKIHGQIVAMLHLNPHRLRIRSQGKNIPYIFAVATLQQYRRQGIMGEMLHHALNGMYAKNIPFTYLIPVAEGIYEPYGFAFISRQGAYNYEAVKIPETFEADAEKNIEKSAENEDIEIVFVTKDNFQEQIKKLTPFLNKILKAHSDCYVNHNNKYFDILLNETNCENGMIGILYVNNKITGYFYTDNDKNPEIRELICVEEYENRLLQKVCDIYGVNSISVKGSLNHIKTEGNPYIMARIIKLESFSHYIGATEDMELLIQVTDSVVTENNGTFLWTFSQGGSQILKQDQPEATDRIHIGELTAWLFGYGKLPSGLTKEIKKKMEKIIPIKNVYINDEV